MKYTLCSARGIKLSCEVPFVKFQWLVLELPAANQRVSNSAFSVSSYILVLRLVCNIVVRPGASGVHLHHFLVFQFLFCHTPPMVTWLVSMGRSGRSGPRPQGLRIRHVLLENFKLIPGWNVQCGGSLPKIN